MVHPLVALLLESQNDGNGSGGDGRPGPSAQKRVGAAGVLDLRRLDHVGSSRSGGHGTVPEPLIRGALRIPSGLAGLDDRFSWLPPPSRKPAHRSQTGQGNLLGRGDVPQGKGLETQLPSAATCKLVLLCEKEERNVIERLLDRWEVAGVVAGGADDANEFWRDAEHAGLIISPAPQSIRPPPDLLFTPSPVVKAILELIDADAAAAAAVSSTMSSGSQGEQQNTASVLDLGCGAGRDIAWMARHGASHGGLAKEGNGDESNGRVKTAWLATGVDNLHSTVRRARLLADELGLSAHSEKNRRSRDRYGFEASAIPRIEAIVWAQASADGALDALFPSASNPSKGVPTANVHRDDKAEGSRSRAVAAAAPARLRAFAAEHLPHETYDVLLFVRFLPHALLHNVHALTHPGSLIAISHFTTLQSGDDQLVVLPADAAAAHREAPSHLRTEFTPGANKRFERAHIEAFICAWENATGDAWNIAHHSITASEDNRPLRHVVFGRQRQDT